MVWYLTFKIYGLVFHVWGFVFWTTCLGFRVYGRVRVRVRVRV